MTQPRRKVYGQPKRPPWRVGIVAPTASEYVRRVTEGVLRFQGEYPAFDLRDFRFANDWPSDDLDDRITSWDRPWEEWKPDGLIVLVRGHPGLVKWVQSAGVPLINGVNGTDLPTVCISPRGVAQKALTHFRSLGFYNIAYISGIENDPRGAALTELVRESGLPELVHFYLADQPADHDSITERAVVESSALGRMLTSLPKPAAILASHDVIGRLICLCAERLDIAIPRELAVMGTGNSVYGLTSNPPLSTIHTPGDSVGYIAAELLLKMMRGERVGHRTEIPPGELIIRASTGAAEEGENQVHLALQMIRDRACDGLTLDELADSVGLSLSTLKRKFQKAQSRSPGAAIATVRAEKALELLRTTELPIANIAKMTGFASASKFSVFFRKRQGVTPSGYRLQVRRA